MFSPTATVEGAPVIATATSACAVIGVVTLTVSSAGFGSLSVLLTVAAFVTEGSAAVDGDRTIVTVAVWPAFSTPMLAITSLPTTEGGAPTVVPMVTVPEMNAMPTGSGSSIATPVAWLGPLFTTVY